MLEIELSEDEFTTRYPLIRDHLAKNTSWSIGNERGCLFETDGAEFIFVLRQGSRRVWTLLEHDGVEFLVSGIPLAKRLGHLISTTPVPEGEVIKVRLKKEEVTAPDRPAV